jgi:hypothetical protein
LSFNHYFRKYFKLVYIRNVVITTLTADIMFLLVTCMPFCVCAIHSVKHSFSNFLGQSLSFTRLFIQSLLIYWLLLLGSVEWSVPSTAAIFWLIVLPHLSSNTPHSSTSALWQHQRHLSVSQGGVEKFPTILLT